jgi:pilus assembly protein CpaC
MVAEVQSEVDMARGSRGGGAGVRGAVAVAMVAALMCACSARKPDDVKADVDDAVKRLHEQTAKAVTEGIQKEIIPPGQEPPSRTERAFAVLKPREPIWLRSGKSRVIQTRGRIDRVAIADPELAGIVVLSPRSFQINAKVLPPQPPPAGGELRAAGGGIFLGRTLTPEPHMAETTITVWGEEGIDVHTLTVADFIDEQVMLDVTIAELDRTAMEQHGIDWRVVLNDFIGAGFMGGGFPPQTLTTVPPQPGQVLLPLTLGSGAPNYVLAFPNQDLTIFLTILETHSLARILAQPKIAALSGQNALFQVGGEIPIRISTAFTTDIAFKAFGTIVNFLPVVSDEGDIMLTVTPEFSEPDFSNEVEGIPSFRTRRASTSARLRNGQTLIIGGLLQTTMVEQVSGAPYLKDIPYLGYLFRQTTYTKQTTELLVVVRPNLMHPLAPGEPVALPTDRGGFTSDEIRTAPDGSDDPARPRLLPMLP